MPADRQRHLAACVCAALDTGCSRPPMLWPSGTISPLGLSPTALAPSFLAAHSAHLLRLDAAGNMHPDFFPW